MRSESIRAANLQCLIKLPELLNLEETQLYQETLTPNSDGDLLTKVHNASGETFAVFSYPKNIHVLIIEYLDFRNSLLEGDVPHLADVQWSAHKQSSSETRRE